MLTVKQKYKSGMNKKSTNKAYQIRETKGVTDHECSHYRWERKNGKKI